jgi:rhodanese-related sulfurtransferase
MSDATRISATEAWEGVQSGNILLVCAYDSDEKFLAHHLEGGISLSEFKTRLSGLNKDQELVFYCA